MHKFDVFISYSRKDKEIAQGVANFLEANGIGCWLDYRDIGVGELWAETIKNAIRNSTVVIAILTEHYNNSPSSENEIVLAARCRKHITYIKFDDSELSDFLAFYLAVINGISANQDKEWQSKLIKDLKQILAHSAKEKCVSELDKSDSSLLNDIQIENQAKAETSECPAWKSTIIDNEEKDALLKLYYPEKS